MRLRFYVKEQYNYLENVLSEYISNKDLHAQLIYFTNENEFDSLVSAAKFIKEDPTINRAVIIDDFGILPFMVTSKFQSIICAQLSEEHSAFMTRDHNNANVISIGAEIVGPYIIKSILKRFVFHKYMAGRHQIRIDMLESMGGN